MPELFSFMNRSLGDGSEAAAVQRRAAGADACAPVRVYGLRIWRAWGVRTWLAILCVGVSCWTVGLWF